MPTARIAVVGSTNTDLTVPAAEGIDTEHLGTDEHAAGGMALIMVDARGDSLIAVAAGANARLTPEHVAAAQPSLPRREEVDRAFRHHTAN